MCKNYADKVILVLFCCVFISLFDLFIPCLVIRCFAFQLSAELERLLKLREVVDADEVVRLRGEVLGLKSAKLELEKNSATLLEENKASSDKVFGLLAENSGLVTECDSLTATVKSLRGDFSSLKESFEAAKVDFASKEKSLKCEKQETLVQLNEVKETLARSQLQALKSFEEGYRECLSRFAADGAEVEKNTFEAYLSDLQNKMGNGGSGSSDHPGDRGE